MSLCVSIKWSTQFILSIPILLNNWGRLQDSSNYRHLHHHHKDWRISIPEGNPLMQSNILYGRGNPHRRHHHHVRSSEVLLKFMMIKIMVIMLFINLIIINLHRRHHHHHQSPSPPSSSCSLRWCEVVLNMIIVIPIDAVIIIFALHCQWWSWSWLWLS